MKKVLVGILAVIGALAILGVFAFAVLALLAAAGGGSKSVPGRVVLELDLERGVIEAIPADPFAKLMLEENLVVHDVVDALDRAADDDRVLGLVARIAGSGVGLAHSQEIRDAVARFRASGKPAVAWSETFGEFSSGNVGYYLATAFDEVYMQPSGDVGLTGLVFETMFMRGTLDKLDIEPQFDQRHEYKNAVNSYTHTEYTPAHREAMQRLLDSAFDQIVRGIADRRGMEAEHVRALVDEGPFLGQEAIDRGLVDGLEYRDGAYRRVRELAGKKASFLYLTSYLERAGRPNSRGTTVALIHGTGAVMRGPGGFSPLDGSIYMGSDSVSRAFRAAIENDGVEAIIFRVDSPGGSYVASDTIWRETVRAREAGKPVIVSMGGLAGSGGYFVAMQADKIVAQPGTLTGSIGVYGGKMVTRELYEKLGITYDSVAAGENAEMFSTIRPYDDAERERWQASLDRIYTDFTQKVADGRGMELDEVLEIAKGRVWTGEDALDRGLVDALGGMDVAVDLVRESLELAADDPIRLRPFPQEQTAFQLLFRPEPENSDDASTRALAGAVRGMQPHLAMLRRLGLVDQPPGLFMPEAVRFDAR